jgi:hypothetical protein
MDTLYTVTLTVSRVKIGHIDDRSNILSKSLSPILEPYYDGWDYVGATNLVHYNYLEVPLEITKLVEPAVVNPLFEINIYDESSIIDYSDD